MGDARDILESLKEDDHVTIRTAFEEIPAVEAVVEGLTSHGVKIELERELEWLGGSRTAWIEYQPAINEDHPVLIGRDGTAPDAAIHHIEVEDD